MQRFTKPPRGPNARKAHTGAQALGTSQVPDAGPLIKGSTGFAVTDGAVRVMLPARAWSHEVVGPALAWAVALRHAVGRAGSGPTAGPREAP